MKTAIFAVSRDGVTLAERIRENIESDIFTMEKYKTADSITFHKLSEEVESQFLNYRAIIFVAAAGIAVRAISGLPVSKLQDPAVIVIDETGKFVIPILSGHIGGANKIAGEIAEIIGAIPVITTATDVKGSIAVDVLAEKIKGEIESMESAKTVTALIAEGKESFIALPANVTFNQNKNTESCIIISNRKNIEIAKIIPKNIVLGIGYKAGTDFADIINFVKEILKELNLEEKSVKTVATCEKKRNEAGIIKTAEAFNAEFKVVINEEILEVEDKFEKSDFVKSQIGVYSVAEPSAYIAGSKRGRFLTGKRKFKGITAAVWEDEISIKE